MCNPFFFWIRLFLFRCFSLFLPLKSWIALFYVCVCVTVLFASQTSCSLFVTLLHNVTRKKSSSKHANAANVAFRNALKGLVGCPEGNWNVISPDILKETSFPKDEDVLFLDPFLVILQQVGFWECWVQRFQSFVWCSSVLRTVWTFVRRLLSS